MPGCGSNDYNQNCSSGMNDRNCGPMGYQNTDCGGWNTSIKACFANGAVETLAFILSVVPNNCDTWSSVVMNSTCSACVEISSYTSWTPARALQCYLTPVTDGQSPVPNPDGSDGLYGQKAAQAFVLNPFRSQQAITSMDAPGAHQNPGAQLGYPGVYGATNGIQQITISASDYHCNYDQHLKVFLTRSICMSTMTQYLTIYFIVDQNFNNSIEIDGRNAPNLYNFENYKFGSDGKCRPFFDGVDLVELTIKVALVGGETDFSSSDAYTITATIRNSENTQKLGELKLKGVAASVYKGSSRSIDDNIFTQNPNKDSEGNSVWNLKLQIPSDTFSDLISLEFMDDFVFMEGSEKSASNELLRHLLQSAENQTLNLSLTDPQHNTGSEVNGPQNSRDGTKDPRPTALAVQLIDDEIVVTIVKSN